MSTVSGVWVLNEVLSNSGWADIAVGETAKETVQVTVGTANPLNCSAIYVNRTDEQHMLYAYNGFTLQIYYWIYNSGEETDSWWNGRDCATFDFGTEPQEVSEVFYEWLTANATQQTVSTWTPDPASLLMGWMAGRRIAGQRGKKE